MERKKYKGYYRTYVDSIIAFIALLKGEFIASRP